MTKNPSVRSQLLDMVERAADRHPDTADPAALVPDLLEEMRGAEEKFLAALLPSAVHELLRQQARGKRAKAASGEELWQAFLKERVATKRGYVFAGDALPSELQDAALRRRSFSGALDRRARQFSEVAIAVQEARLPNAKALGEVRGGLLLQELEVRSGIVRKQRLVVGRRASTLRTAERHRDALLRMREQQTAPILVFLKSHRDELKQLLADTLEAIERGATTDKAWDGAR